LLTLPSNVVPSRTFSSVCMLASLRSCSADRKVTVRLRGRC
jgi:hypothetical protein